MLRTLVLCLSLTLTACAGSNTLPADFDPTFTF